MVFTWKPYYIIFFSNSPHKAALFECAGMTFHPNAFWCTFSFLLLRNSFHIWNRYEHFYPSLILTYMLDLHSFNDRQCFVLLKNKSRICTFSTPAHCSTNYIYCTFLKYDHSWITLQGQGCSEKLWSPIKNDWQTLILGTLQSRTQENTLSPPSFHQIVCSLVLLPRFS